MTSRGKTSQSKLSDPLGYKEMLEARIKEMNRRIEELETERATWERLETALVKTHDLGERMKELICLRSLIRLSMISSNPFARSAQMVRIIKDGWQYPAITCVRIKWDQQEIKSGDLRHLQIRQVEPITVKGQLRGEIEVGYSAAGLKSRRQPFLEEEKNLLRSIALWLSLVIEKRDPTHSNSGLN